MEIRDFTATMGRSMAESLSRRALTRIKAEMATKHLNQTELGGILEWSQSKMSKVLNGRVELTVDDLDALCFGVGLSPVETVRDHGLQFCAELKPTELRLLERFRQLPPYVRDAIMELLNVRGTTRLEERRAVPRQAKIKPPRL